MRSAKLAVKAQRLGVCRHGHRLADKVLAGRLELDARRSAFSRGKSMVAQLRAAHGQSRRLGARPSPVSRPGLVLLLRV